jgi:hypothetical protein
MLEQLIRKMKRLVSKKWTYNSQHKYDSNYNGYSWLDYYDNINIIDNHLSSLTNLIKPKVDQSEVLLSKKTFNPFNIPFDITYAEVLKLSGIPNYSIDNTTRMPNSIVIFYKKRIGNIKLTTQLHFFEDKLFLVKTDFSNSHSSESIHVKIAKLTVKKYAEMDLTIAAGMQLIHLQDENKSRLTIDISSVNPSIIYVSGNYELREKILDFINTRKTERTSKEKLINDELFNKL